MISHGPPHGPPGGPMDAACLTRAVQRTAPDSPEAPDLAEMKHVASGYVKTIGKP